MSFWPLDSLYQCHFDLRIFYKSCFDLRDFRSWPLRPSDFSILCYFNLLDFIPTFRLFYLWKFRNMLIPLLDISYQCHFDLRNFRSRQSFICTFEFISTFMHLDFMSFLTKNSLILYFSLFYFSAIWNFAKWIQMYSIFEICVIGQLDLRTSQFCHFGFRTFRSLIAISSTFDLFGPMLIRVKTFRTMSLRTFRSYVNRHLNFDPGPFDFNTLFRPFLLFGHLAFRKMSFRSLKCAF